MFCKLVRFVPFELEIISIKKYLNKYITWKNFFIFLLSILKIHLKYIWVRTAENYRFTKAAFRRDFK